MQQHASNSMACKCVRRNAVVQVRNDKNGRYATQGRDSDSARPTFRLRSWRGSTTTDANFGFNGLARSKPHIAGGTIE
jgi:hypothetical protein